MVDRDPGVRNGDGGMAVIVASTLIVAMVAIGVIFFANFNRPSSPLIDLNAVHDTSNGPVRPG